jgi:phage terminase large subunit-like protein
LGVWKSKKRERRVQSRPFAETCPLGSSSPTPEPSRQLQTTWNHTRESQGNKSQKSFAQQHCVVAKAEGLVTFCTTQRSNVHVHHLAASSIILCTINPKRSNVHVHHLAASSIILCNINPKRSNVHVHHLAASSIILCTINPKRSNVHVHHLAASSIILCTPCRGRSSPPRPLASPSSPRRVRASIT